MENPSIPDAINRIVERGVTHLFIMPMYPHYAMSSYETVVVKVEESIREKSPHLHRTLLQPFYQDSDYIEALSESVAPYIGEDLDNILFSYHGVPERHLKKNRSLPSALSNHSKTVVRLVTPLTPPVTVTSVCEPPKRFAKN